MCLDCRDYDQSIYLSHPAAWLTDWRSACQFWLLAGRHKVLSAILLIKIVQVNFLAFYFNCVYSWIKRLLAFNFLIDEYGAFSMGHHWLRQQKKEEKKESCHSRSYQTPIRFLIENFYVREHYPNKRRTRWQSTMPGELDAFEWIANCDKSMERQSISIHFPFSWERGILFIPAFGTCRCNGIDESE